MKKLFMLAVACMASVFTYADVELKSGSVTELKSPEASVLVTWDYDDMLIEGKSVNDFLAEKGSDWQKDYPSEVSASELAFGKVFNKKCKKFAKITDEAADAQYVFVIHVKKFNYGSTAAAVMLGGYARGAYVEGTVEVVSKANREVIAIVDFDCSGQSSYSNEQRRILAFMDFASDLAKLINKAK